MKMTFASLKNEVSTIKLTFKNHGEASTKNHPLG